MGNTPPITGLVLAGGRSRRMGADKALIEIAGQNLLDRAVAILSQELADVRVAVRPDQAGEDVRSAHNVVEDRFQDIGPAAGILSAHLSSPASAWFVIACDMPLVDLAMVRLMLASRDVGADATAWASDDDGGVEPLCAIYEPGTLAAFVAALRSGGNPSPRAWLAAANVRLLNTPAAGLLKSANTQTELDQMIAKIGSRSGVSSQDDA